MGAGLRNHLFPHFFRVQGAAFVSRSISTVLDFATICSSLFSGARRSLFISPN
jgi:hypothetical protein